MKTYIIIISIFLYLVVYLQGTIVVSHHPQYPIGPKFVRIPSTKQQLYYNNHGTRLDCLATGNPSPSLKWFRSNGSSDDRPSTIVRPSEFIDVFENGTLFIRPFRDYSKLIHAGTFVCQAENPAGSIQTTSIQLKPQIYDTYELEVKNVFGFEQSSAILSCEISPPSASSFVQVIGWTEKIDDKITSIDLRARTRYNLLANKNLIIHNISKSDEKRNYACIANNQIDNQTRQSRYKQLRVRDRSPFGAELTIANNTEYRTRAGDPVELPCGISSVSINARISWLKNGVEIENLIQKTYDNSLLIESATVTDSGHYICRIDDEFGSRLTSHMTLDVDVPNQCQMLVAQTSINAGSNMELTCSASTDTRRNHQWKWYHNSKLISTKDERYSINNATRAHMGMYQCCYIISSSDSNDCCAQTQILVINSPPFIVNDQPTHSDVIIVRSENRSHVPIDLNCTIYADPKAHIEIVKDGRILSEVVDINHLPSGDTFVNYRIHVSNLNDTGLYQCRAKNSFGSATFSKHVNIEGQKPHLEPIDDVYISSGQEFRIACYGSGQPNLELKWIDETNQQIVNVSTTSPVILTSIKKKSNLYRCQAINSYGEVSTDVRVIVQVAAKILSVTTNKTVKINESLDVFCSAEGDQPLNLMIINPRKISINASQSMSSADSTRQVAFTIARIQMSDSGLYQCYVKTNQSEDRSTFHITVQNVPNKVDSIKYQQNNHRLVWNRPFDGNSPILKYILRIRSLNLTNKTYEILSENQSDQTFYSLEHLSSNCALMITIEAVNIIGSSLPSDPFPLQMSSKKLQMAPSNLTALNITSKSLTLEWLYPYESMCPYSVIEYEIEIVDRSKQTLVERRKQKSTNLDVENLKSFHDYLFVVYALNEFGRSPPSTPILVQTLESVPLISVVDLAGTLIDSSSIQFNWTLDKQNMDLLNGKFRTFSLSIYRDFNLSTLIHVETIQTHLILNEIQTNSVYFAMVAVCNRLDCGPSSSVIRVHSSTSASTVTFDVAHPINKPLLLKCSSDNPSWLQNGQPTRHGSMLKNGSLMIIEPKFIEDEGNFRCQSTSYNIRYYNKPTMVQAKLHYATTNEIGLKLHFPPEIIENLTILYQNRPNNMIQQLDMNPISTSVRLTNLTCGTLYELTIFGSNQVGSSLKEHIFVKTEGSIPQLMEPMSLLETISNNFIVLNMSQWKINQCAIVAFEIEIFSSANSSEDRLTRKFSNDDMLNEVRIDDLQSNREYQLHLKVNTEAGELIQVISFRTNNDQDEFDSRSIQSYLIVTIVLVSLLFISITIVITCLLMKLCRRQSQRRKLKTMIYSSYPDHYHGTWLKSNNEFTMENYSTEKIQHRDRPYSFASEDSQGNINPYAVTFQQTPCWKETKQLSCFHDSRTSSERYFRPIVLESAAQQDYCQRNPLVQINVKCSPTNSSNPGALSSTVSSSSNGEIFSAFSFVVPTKTNSDFGKKSSHPTIMLTDQSSSSADSGVHSSCAQSPIIKQSILFDRPSSVQLQENRDKHLYAMYDQQFSFVRESSSQKTKPVRTGPSFTIGNDHQEQYSLV